MNRRVALQSLAASIAMVVACLAEEPTSLAGNAWRLSDVFPSGVSAAYDVMFCDGGHLTNLDEIADPTAGDDQWERLAETVTLRFNDGYATYEGTLSEDGDSISGAATNQRGLEWSWSAEKVGLPRSTDVATESWRELGNGPFREEGALSSDDRIVDRKYRDRFEFTAGARARISVELESDDFDTYLILEDLLCGFRETDDDGGSGTDSRIEAELQAAGIFRVIVTSFGAGATGSYVLRVAFD